MKKLIIILSLLLVIIDQIIKYIVISNLNLLDSINIIPNFLNITYVTNSGGAFSILSGNRYLFIILGFIAVIYIIRYIMSYSNITKVDLIAYSLVISGIIGNLIDRIIYGYVIDYIHFYISSYSFAIFNFADMCIVIGVILIIYNLFIKGDSYETNNGRK
jgi:signal peptidase II